MVRTGAGDVVTSPLFAVELLLVSFFSCWPAGGGCAARGGRPPRGLVCRCWLNSNSGSGTLGGATCSGPPTSPRDTSIRPGTCERVSTSLT